MMAGGSEAVTTPVTINTNLVKPEEIKSYNDLLNPKWKGKILQGDPTVPGGGMSVGTTALGIMGEDFIKKLLEQQPMVVREKRLESEWLAQGKYSIGFGMDNRVATEFIESGAPFVQLVPREGASIGGGSGQIVIFKQAPHPNAAKVFLNWLLSKEGQSIYHRPGGNGSRRKDVANEWLLPARRPQPGIPYLREGEDYYTVVQEQLIQKIRALYVPYLTR